MDPKISKKTQDTLGKIIKKPPLTDKLLAKPPFRFLHDVMTSVIKTTGVMKGLYTDSELNSENVKDKESKMAFLQKAVDFVAAASGKNLNVKPAKVVAGHEPEKTNEFLQALAAACNSKVDSDQIIDKMNNKGGSSKKEEKKEERSKDKDREKSGDRRRRDDQDRKSKDKDREKSRDRDERHKEKEDRHKEKEDRHKDRDRDRERESRHKSGRSRSHEKDQGHEGKRVGRIGEAVNDPTPTEVDSDIFGSDSDVENIDPRQTPLNTTFAVTHPTQMELDQAGPSQDTSARLIPRQVSTYREMRRPDNLDEDGFSMDEPRMRTKRPKAARPRREHRPEPPEYIDPLSQDPPTPYVSEDDNLRDDHAEYRTPMKKNAPVVKKTPIDGRKAKGETRNNSEERKAYGGAKESPIRSAESTGNPRTKQQRPDPKRGPKTSTPKNSPESPRRGSKPGPASIPKERGFSKPFKHGDTQTKGNAGKAKSGKLSGKKVTSAEVYNSPETKPNKSADRRAYLSKEKTEKSPLKKAKEVQRDVTEESQIDDTSGVTDYEKSNERARKSHRRKKRSRELEDQTEESESDQARKTREKIRYRNDDYEHDKVKKSKKHRDKYIDMYEDELYDDERRTTDTTDSDERLAKRKDRAKRRQHRQGDPVEDEAYYIRKKPNGADSRKRSSFTTMQDKSDAEKREDEGKENDAPRKDMVNGDADHKPADAPVKMQRPSSAKGSRRRMEGGLDSSDEDVPVQRNEPALGEDDLPPQVAGRMARPSSARPAPPKRKEDVVHNEPAMRLGSGKPQNLIIDDGKDSDDDETFVVEESAPPPVEQEQQRMGEENEEEDDEDHGGLVKKIMETKKEYEQQRKTEIERPTISDAQRRKQREAVQREIDKLRSSIQTLTRSANPLGKIMDYVQEDLDSMQKELEKWKAENKEHGLALKREKAITDRAVEPLKVQLSEVDQAIKDQLELIGAVKSNIIRNDQKIEKMLRTIAKS